MNAFSVDRCPVCQDHPDTLHNSARAAGRFVCPAGCSGDVAAVSGSVAVEVVDVTLDKTVCPTCTLPGETVRYTITVCNRSSVAATRVLVTDPGIEALLEVGTIYVNGQSVSGSLRSGVVIPGLGAGCCAAVTFDARVPEDAVGEISNTAHAEFEFSSAICPLTRASVASNRAVLTVNAPGLEVVKTADRCAVTPGAAEVVFTLTVTNTGTCPIEDVVVTDELPDGLTYVTLSTSVNGGAPFDRDPAAGVALGALQAGEDAVVTFRARAAF